MAPRKNAKKKAETPEVNIGAEIFASLRELEKIKGIPVDYMVERLKQALTNAYRKDREDHRDVPAENVVVNISEEGLTMHQIKTVVEDLEDLALEIPLDAARRINPSLKVGDTVAIPVDIQKFGRIAAQTAKQVVIQGIREAERGVVYESYSSKSQELLTGTVLRIDPSTGDMFVRIGQGNEQNDAVLRASEQIPGETYHEGDLIRVYVLEVTRLPAALWFTSPAPIPMWCAACLSWKPLKSPTAMWRSATLQEKPVPAPRWPSVPPRRALIPSVPVSAPGAAVSVPLWRSSTARRSTLWFGARIPVNMSAPPSALPMCCP